MSKYNKWISNSFISIRAKNKITPSDSNQSNPRPSSFILQLRLPKKLIGIAWPMTHS